MVVATVAFIAGPPPAHADGGDPIGYFDSISARLGLNSLQPTNPGSRWELFGWAADPDAPGQQLDVHIYVDGQLTTVTHTGDARPDVAAVFGFAGPDAGWHSFVGADDGLTHTVCAYAINVGAGTDNTTLGCQSVPSPGTSIADPQGNIDAITVTPGLARFQGWTGDGDAPSVTPVRPVIDGTTFDSFMPTFPRDDARAAFPGLQNASGFDATLAMLPGSHQVCFYAGNDGPNGINNTTLGCAQLDVPDVQPPGPGDARGSFDAITFDNNTSKIYFEGWSWKPGSAGPYAVRIRQIQHRFDFFDRNVNYDGETGEPRPDVHQAYPDAPGDAGFRIAEPYLYAHTPSPDYTCAFAVDDGSERLLGCKTAG
jgi:hypothetical protein